MLTAFDLPVGKRIEALSKTARDSTERWNPPPSWWNLCSRHDASLILHLTLDATGDCEIYLGTTPLLFLTDLTRRFVFLLAMNGTRSAPRMSISSFGSLPFCGCDSDAGAVSL